MTSEEARAIKFDIRKVYVKDMSFESPQAPNIFTQVDQTPTIDVQMGLSHSLLNEEGAFYEVVLTVTAAAKASDKTIFLAEVQQAGVFQIEGVKEDELPLALEVACPNMLLPFAREAVSDLVGKGGFPQLLINPVNFEVLYQKKRDEIDKNRQQSETSGVTIN
jgi:preprotein translocase subunit SecB